MIHFVSNQMYRALLGPSRSCNRDLDLFKRLPYQLHICWGCGELREPLPGPPD